MKKILIIAVASILTVGCGKPDVWTGYAYPDKYDLSIMKRTGNFKSLKQCRYFTRSKIDRYEGTYECGLNCSGTYCEITKR